MGGRGKLAPARTVPTTRPANYPTPLRRGVRAKRRRAALAEPVTLIAVAGWSEHRDDDPARCAERSAASTRGLVAIRRTVGARGWLAPAHEGHRHGRMRALPNACWIASSAEGA